ncbi:28848_t:CDS:2, partial [Racocetra persica]
AFFATPEKQHKWHIQLNSLAQLENEKVDAYATKFKKLLSRVDPTNSLPDQYIVRMFLSGLKGKTATFVAVTSPNSLNEAIAAARKVEAGEYYGTHLHETPVTPDKKDELIEALVKQVQQLSVNYVAATNQQEKDTREKERYKEISKPRKEIVCYRCGEKGHIARYCLSEKKYKEPNEEERRPTDNVRRVNYCEYEEDELYVVDKRKQQVQPDTPDKRPRLQPESKWDNRLRPRTENEPLLVDVGGQIEPMELGESRSIKKPRRKRGPSVIDRLEIDELFYNPWEESASPALYLTDIEEMPTKEEKETELTVEKQIEKFLQNETLTKEEKEKAAAFFQQERNLFTSDMQGLGETTVITHRIETGEAKPIKQKASGSTHWNADALSRINGTEEVAEVYMAIEEDSNQESEKEKGEEQIKKKRTNLPEFEEETIELRTQPTPLMQYIKLGTKYRRNLEYTGPSKSDWVIFGAKQELIRRNYLRDTGIDLGYTEPLNVQAIEEERNANRREDRRVINLGAMRRESNN